jgi:uncharacterized protein DUF3307
VSWVSVFASFLVGHMVGDYLFQTDWQARHKRGGLGRDPVARRALWAHVATYTLAFVPALIWIGDQVGAEWAVLTAVLIAVPHAVLDDGRFLRLWLRRVKRAETFDRGLAASVDQSFHVLCLSLAALLLSAA